MLEIELKFFDINVKEIMEKLQSLGAKEVYSEEIYSMFFLKKGYDSWDTSKKSLRLRRIGTESFLTYQDPAINSNMKIRKEIEIKVSDFEETKELIQKLDFKIGKIISKHRVHYELGNIHFEFDTISDIPTYLEVETRTTTDMTMICKKLGLDIKEGKKGTIGEIFPEKF